MQAIVLTVVCRYCCIYREALATKYTCPPPGLQDTSNEIVKFFNHIKILASNTRPFEVSCEEICSDHKQMLLHTHAGNHGEGFKINSADESRTASLSNG